jgi:hypothetical protein
MAAMRAILLVLALGGVAGAEGKPKLAALILKSGTVEQELADNLTEVLIGRLARRGEYEIAGKEELKAKLGVDDKSAADCIENVSCLGRAGTELGVMRVVVGTLGKRGADYLYNLSLIDIASGRAENRVFELVAGGKVDSLIAAVQANADRLFAPKIEPGGVRVLSQTRGAMVYLDDSFVGSTPVRRDGVEPGLHKLRVEKDGHQSWTKDVEVPPASTLDIQVPMHALPELRKWPGPLSLAMIGIGGGAAIVGIVILALSTDAPIDSAVTRRDALDSANRRHFENVAGMGLLGIGGGLIVIGAGLAIGYRHDIFPSRDRGKTASVYPTANGLMVEW